MTVMWCQANYATLWSKFCCENPVVLEIEMRRHHLNKFVELSSLGYVISLVLEISSAISVCIVKIVHQSTSGYCNHLDKGYFNWAGFNWKGYNWNKLKIKLCLIVNVGMYAIFVKTECNEC